MSLHDVLSSVYSDYLSEDYIEMMEEILEIHELSHLLKETIVDLGCGSGRILHLLKKKYGCNAIGVDLRPTPMYGDVYYLITDVRHIGLVANRASFVFSINIADFLDYSLTAESIFKEVDRILIPGGVYLPTVIDSDRLGQPYKRANYNPIYCGYQKP